MSLDDELFAASDPTSPADLLAYLAASEHPEVRLAVNHPRPEGRGFGGPASS